MSPCPICELGCCDCSIERIQELEAACAAMRPFVEELLQEELRYQANDFSAERRVAIDARAEVLRAALATDAGRAGKAIQTELACLRVVCGWVPLSIREAIRTGDLAKCEAWAKKGEDIQAQAYEGCAQVAETHESSLNRLGGGYYEDDVRRNRMRGKEIAAAIRAKALRPEDGT